MAGDQLETAYQIGRGSALYLENGHRFPSQEVKSYLFHLRCDIAATSRTQLAELTLEGVIGAPDLKKGELPDHEEIIKGIASSILKRNISSDPQGSSAERLTASLLQQFIRGLVDGGITKGLANSVVKSTIVEARKECAKRTSYAAIDAVTYLDDILDELGVSRNISIRAKRAIEKAKNVVRYNGDILQTRRKILAGPPDLTK